MTLDLEMELNVIEKILIMLLIVCFPIMKITEFKNQVLGVILNGNNYSADMSSTSKINVALGGITPPAPDAP